MGILLSTLMSWTELAISGSVTSAGEKGYFRRMNMFLKSFIGKNMSIKPTN